MVSEGCTKGKRHWLSDLDLSYPMLAFVVSHQVFGLRYIISVLEISPYIAVSMGGYNILKGRWLDESSSAWSSLAVGWLSGTCASLVTCSVGTTQTRE